MLIVLKSREAEEDLVNIWLYTCKIRGEEQADKYLDDLEKAIRRVAEAPLLCRLRSELALPVRIQVQARHLIVYEEIEAGINIVRALHSSMDREGQLL